MIATAGGGTGIAAATETTGLVGAGAGVGAAAGSGWAEEIETIAERIEDGRRNAVGCGMDDADEELDDSDRGESFGLLACDASRDNASTGDALPLPAGDVAVGVGARLIRLTGVAETVGLETALAERGRTAAEAGREAEEADEGVVVNVAVVLLTGETSLLVDVMDDVVCGAVMVEVGLRSAGTVAVGETSLDAVGLAVADVDAGLLSAVLLVVVVVADDTASLRAVKLLTAILDGGTSGMAVQRDSAVEVN